VDFRDSSLTLAGWTGPFRSSRFLVCALLADTGHRRVEPRGVWLGGGPDGRVTLLIAQWLPGGDRALPLSRTSRPPRSAPSSATCSRRAGYQAISKRRLPSDCLAGALADQQTGGAQRLGVLGAQRDRCGNHAAAYGEFLGLSSLAPCLVSVQASNGRSQMRKNRPVGGCFLNCAGASWRETER
jgi:hypothetical protein